MSCLNHQWFAEERLSLRLKTDLTMNFTILEKPAAQFLPPFFGKITLFSPKPDNKCAICAKTALCSASLCEYST